MCIRDSYYVEDMPMAYQQEGLNVRFSGVGYSLEEGKIPPTMLTEEFFCLHDYTITPMEDWNLKKHKFIVYLVETGHAPSLQITMGILST